MRKIIGIGETIMDIIFRDGQPTAAVPGGSVFNGIISLGRLHQPATIISETGNDRVGQVILQFLRDNGVDPGHVAVYKDGRSAISLAWLNERNEADYIFYKDYPNARLEVDWPLIQSDDIVVMGSYFVLNPILRPKVSDFLAYARRQGALIYYDFNYRSSHRDEVDAVFPTVLSNVDVADIVRGSVDDYEVLFACGDPDAVYARHVRSHCGILLSTAAGSAVRLHTPTLRKSYAVPPIETVSTIGAGDNFNAGIVFGLMHYGIRRADLPGLSETDWDRIVQCGIDLSTEACRSIHNSISTDFAQQYLSRLCH